MRGGRRERSAKNEMNKFWNEHKKSILQLLGYPSLLRDFLKEKKISKQKFKGALNYLKITLTQSF